MATAPVASRPPKHRYSLLTRRDKITLGLMIGIPTAIAATFVWLPTILSFFLSFTSWDGIGGLDKIQFTGLRNYQNLFAGLYSSFYPAMVHNFFWLLVLTFIAMPIGMFLAVLLDKEIRGTRFYQSAIYMPVVLSLAIIGFIWQLIYSPDQGLINSLAGTANTPGAVDWLGDHNINLFAILVAACWRHIGYVMVLYLAGLKSVDPTLREAAQIDGANEAQTFFRVVLPVMRPVNIVVLVITVIESLRAFDLVYVTNKGTNGLELLSVLVTNNIIGEASRIGFGSAIAMILLAISVGPIVVYLSRAMREERV